jgi:Mg/Co/Ni transporter MgtE
MFSLHNGGFLVSLSLGRLVTRDVASLDGIALTVGLALIGIVLWGTLAGSMLPLS